MGNKYTFWKLLDENSIEIPIIQRDYAQGREEENKIRDKFLDVLYNKIEKAHATVNLDFVYGRIIDKKLIPLDGQQRLTTLFLLHWYLATKEKKLDESNNSSKLQKFTYETRVSSREFCKALTTNKIDLLDIDSFIGEKDRKLSRLIEDKNWFFKSWKKDPTIKSMLNMLDAIHEKFKNSDDLFNKLICDDKPPITFDFLPLNDFNLSDELYIKINARGKPLTPFENFKSNFVELLNPETAIKLDNEWTDLFWSFKGDEKEDGYYYIDDKFLNFFTNFTINLGINSDILLVKKDLKDIDIMDVYQIILNAEDTNENLSSLINTLNKLSNINKQSIKIPYFEVFIEKKDISNWDRAKFHSLAMYLLKNKDIDFESDKYKDWERVTKNIIDNFNIDSLKKFQDTLKLISTMSEKIDKLYEYLASDEFLSSDKQNMGHRSLEFQQKEEQLKAKFVIKDHDSKWKNAITNAESHEYLNGHIGFLIEISNNDIEKFQQYFKKFSEIFVEDKENFFLQRALLSKGDYLVGEISEWKNRTFCSFETSQRAKDDNWKQVFHDKNKRGFLKDLLDDDSNLKKIIEDFKETNNWRYGFIKNPEILKYCQQCQIRMASEHDILLLTKERTSGLHAEYYTYSLFLEIKKLPNIVYKDQSSIESTKYISLDCDKVKIIYGNYDDVWQYKKESNGKYKYYEKNDQLIANLTN